MTSAVDYNAAGSSAGSSRRSRQAVDDDGVVGDLHSERTGFTTDVLGLEGDG